MRKQPKSSEQLQARTRPPASTCVSAARIAGFHENYQEPIRVLSSLSDRVGDLAESFPALLFALGSGYGDKETRGRVFDMIRKGASLKSAAAAYALPYWLRKLPPQTFSDPLRSLPDGPIFSRRIVNFIPTSPGAANSWFERVCDACAFGGEGYALWMARQKRLPFSGDGQDALLLLGAWVWGSVHPDSNAHHLLRRPWSELLSLKRAYDEARAWERRIDMAITLGTGTADMWFAGANVMGFDFVPLRTVEDFLAESEAMGNCLDQYADPINETHVRVFSIRKDGVTIANVEIAPHDDDCLMPGIEQLRGPRNNRAAPEVWRAAYAWLGQQDFRVFPGPSHGGRPAMTEAWERIWTPILDDISHRPLRKRLRTFARQAHGAAGVRREASRVMLNI